MKDSKGISFVKDIILNDTELSSLPISPPKKLINSVKIKCAKVQPTCINPDSTSDFTKFAAIQAGTLHWYDIGSETNISEKVDKFNLDEAMWNFKIEFRIRVFNAGFGLW